MKFNCASSSAWLSRKKLQIVYESSVSIALIYIWLTELEELKYDKSVQWNTETMCCTSCCICKTASAPLLPNTADISPASKDVLARKIGTTQCISWALRYLHTHEWREPGPGGNRFMVGSKTTLWIMTNEQGSRKMQKGRTTLKWNLSRMNSHDRIEFHTHAALLEQLLTTSACCPWRVLAVCGLHCPPEITGGVKMCSPMTFLLHH